MNALADRCFVDKGLGCITFVVGDLHSVCTRRPLFSCILVECLLTCMVGAGGSYLYANHLLVDYSHVTI